MLENIFKTGGTFWLIFGFMAQSCFFLRFLVQWLASEKKSQCVIPISFWYLSIMGSVGILVYSIHRRDPVFIVGQLAALFVYIRNIILEKKMKSKL